MACSNTTMAQFDGHDRNGDRQYCEILVTTIVRDDNSVIQQVGQGCEWVEIREPDKEVFIIGACRDCGLPIAEDDDWEYDVKQKHLRETQRTIWHDKRIGCPARPGDEDY